MKLLYCPSCGDVRRLWVEEPTACRCGASWGRYYPDGLRARYGGRAVPIGIDNSSLSLALMPLPEDDGFTRTTLVPNPRIDAWIITDTSRIEREEE